MSKISKGVYSRIVFSLLFLIILLFSFSSLLDKS